MSKITTLTDTVGRWKQNLDPYATRGVRPEYRKGMRLFWWYGFLISTASAFADSYVTLYALALGASSLQIGTLSSASSFMAMLAPIPGAQWTARWGKRKAVVLISFGLRRLVLLCALLAPFFFTGERLIYAAIALFALRAGLANLGNPAWMALAADIVPVDRRGRYFSSRKMVMALASMLFVPLAGQIIELFAVPRGYQITFGVSIIISAIALGGYYSRIPESTTPAPSRQGNGFKAFLHALTGNRVFLLFSLTTIVWNFAWQFGGPYFSVYQVEVLRSTPRIIGLLSTAAALMRVVGQPFWGRVIDRHGARWTRAICTLIIPILPFFWIPMTKPWHALFVTVPSGFMWAGYELANFNLLLELPDKRYQTQAIASYTTLIGLANIAGPLVGGQVVETLGFHWTFALSGIGRMVGAILFIIALKPFGKRDAEIAPTQNLPETEETPA